MCSSSSSSSSPLPSPAPAPTTAKARSRQLRVRQHLNPLARRWSEPTQLPADWYAEAFADGSLPLVVDVGVAKGRFLLRMAQQRRDFNYLGIEIRRPLVDDANRRAQQLGLNNLTYVAANANVSLRRILSAVPAGAVQQVLIQFCDPWFKKRHAKRRMVTTALVHDVHAVLQHARAGAARVFVQTDVLQVATEMTQRFDAHGGFTRLENEHELRVDAERWLLANPLGVATERELAVSAKGARVYRALYAVGGA